MKWHGAKKAITQASAIYMTTPNPDEGKGGGLNNNNLIAIGVEAGRILKAVYDQPEDKKCWLLYAYSEMLSNSDIRKLCFLVTAKVLADYQKAYGQIKTKKLAQYKMAISRAIVDFKGRMNSGTAMHIRELSFELCGINNWHRDFGRIHRMTQRHLDELDKEGLTKVVEVLEKLKNRAA